MIVTVGGTHRSWFRKSFLRKSPSQAFLRKFPVRTQGSEEGTRNRTKDWTVSAEAGDIYRDGFSSLPIGAPMPFRGTEEQRCETM